MNLIRSVFMPRAAESVIGSGRVKPKAISSESIPHSSARRQNSTWRSRLKSPDISVVALVLRSLSPTCDKLQWNRKGISAFLELTLRMTVQADLIESHPDQTVNATSAVDIVREFAAHWIFDVAVRIQAQRFLGRRGRDFDHCIPVRLSHAKNLLNLIGQLGG